jgi:hypothetical protein
MDEPDDDDLDCEGACGSDCDSELLLKNRLGLSEKRDRWTFCSGWGGVAGRGGPFFGMLIEISPD